MKMNVRSFLVGFCVSLTAVVLSSCDSGEPVEDDVTRWNDEVRQIDADLESATLPVLRDPSGVRILVSKLGAGLPGQPWNNIDIDYAGRRYTDKVSFDQGTVNGKLSGYIPGWQIAFSKIPAGSEGKLIIPSYYGYGPSGQGQIPGNTILEFDFKFKKVSLTTLDAQRLKTDTAAIDAYLLQKGITPQTDTTGLRYVITTPGTGNAPGWFDKLRLSYTIKLLTDDTKVITTIDREPTDDFYSRPVDFITGMKIGLLKLKPGAKATLYIPSGYAFGPDGVSDNKGNTIPGNSNVIIEVELVEIL
jgi:FKBP-type peptidyl-prolyl cis-trans isomerase FkpA